MGIKPIKLSIGNNGLDVSVSTDEHDIHRVLDAVVGMLFAAGFPLSVIEDGILEMADEINVRNGKKEKCNV